MAAKTTNTRRAVSIAGIATSCVLGLVLGPSTAHADPVDKTSVQAQIVKTQHDLEVVAEEYNDAKIKLAELNEAKAAAEAAANDASASLGDEKQKVADTGATLYKGPALADAATLMTSSSPQEVIDRLSMLSAISDHYGQSLQDLQSGQNAAASAQEDASNAAAAAAATEQELAAKKADIEAKLPALQVQLDSLSDTEKQAVLAQSGGHATPGASSSAAPASTQTTTVSAGTGGSGTAQGAVQAALSKLGSPYVWGAAGPNAFDCSGLTMWAYGQVGLSLPHSSGAQSSAGSSVALSALAPGDIVWMPGHVDMYVGNGQVVHAPISGDVVKVVPLSSMGWQKGVRVA